MQTVVIKNGYLYDGLGNPPFKGDLLIEGDTIKAVGSVGKGDYTHCIDATGMVVCPGFVDMHRHCDIKPLCDASFGEVELLQGITTTVVGNCGISYTPTNPIHAEEVYRINEPVLGPVDTHQIYTYQAYMEQLDQVALPLNFASMIGTGSVRIAVKGFEDTPFTKEEMKQAKKLIEEALEEGAVGISVGIMYIPECYTSTAEFVEMLEPVGKKGRIVTAHIRGEGDSMVESVKEIIEIGKKASCAVEVSHFKSVGMKNWRHDVNEAIQAIEKAQEEGQQVTCDFYPYEGGSTTLVTMLPPAFVKGDMTAAIERLGAPEGVANFRETSRRLYVDWDNFAITLGWDRIMISGVKTEKNKKFIGLSLTEATTQFDYEDVEACVADLLYSEKGNVAIINMGMCQEDIDTIAQLPYTAVISDAIYADTKTPHPRMYGAFPKILREYVQERGIYTLEDALRRMTSLPAKRMQLTGRGSLEVGNFADINIFDEKSFRDHATFVEPAKLATGLEWCLINGKVAVHKGKVVCRACGSNIRA